MKRGLSTLTALCALFWMNVSANASVVSIFSVTPGVVSAGQQSTLDLLLSLSPDPGYFNAQFTGGSVMLDSGIGPSQILSISPGGTSQDFNFAFTYPTAGNVTPAFSYIANYTEEYSVWVSSGYYIYYSCGFLGDSTCWYWQDTSHYNYYGWDTGNASSGIGSLQVSAVDPIPVPATLPLFASGLVGLGLLGWHRKRKAQAAA